MGERKRAHGWTTQKLPSHLRGYGPAHKKLRAQWAVAVNRGGVNCWRCGQVIVPGSDWQLGHDDNDRTQYKGPEHRSCNLGGASAKAHAIRRNKDPKPNPQTKW